MSADRIRTSSSPVSYDAYARSNATSYGSPAAGAASSSPTAAPSEAPQSPYGQSGFDSGATQYAQPTTSGTYESAIVQTPPAAAEPAPAAAEPAPAANPHAQLDAMKQMSLEEKKEFLKQFGVTDKALKKSKPHEIENAFNQIVDQLKTPGDAKLKFKIGGKKFEAKIRLDPTRNELDIQIKQKKGFFGKVWDGIKKYGKIALTVASFIPGPIGVAARIANAVISAIGAFKKGDILGGLAAAAGAIAGGASALAGKAVSGVAKTVATVASAVEKGATAAKGIAEGIKNKNWGGVLTAVASGASGVAGALGEGAKKLANTMNEVSTWATRGNTALQAAAAAKNGDIIGALSAGSELVSGMAPNSRAADTFQRLAASASTAQTAYNAARRGDLLGALSAGADFAADQVKDGSKAKKRLEDVSVYSSAANKVKNGDVLGAISEGASHAATRSGQNVKARNTLNDISSYAKTADTVHKAVRSGDYMGAAQLLTQFAAGEVNDPVAQKKLKKASEIFQGADVVENAIQSKDYLAAAKAAAALAGKLTGSDEMKDAEKLLAAADGVRTAVKTGGLRDVIKAMDTLGKTVKDVTQQTGKRAIPEQVAAPALPVGDDTWLQSKKRAVIF
ncbi:MAG TPA: hypothetical protein VF815_23830 [Myxococcaceae bacterium]|jgi:hypothetical protein